MPTVSGKETFEQITESEMMIRRAKLVQALFDLNNFDSITFESDIDIANEAIQNELFDDAKRFYLLDRNAEDSLENHREITQAMTKTTIDLNILPMLERMDEFGADEIVVVLPLRGALAMGTQEVQEHLRKRLDQLGRESVPIRMAALGIKRDGEAGTAQTYFEHGVRGESAGDNSESFYLIPDWGTATGATFELAAKHINERTGVGFGRMMSMSMTISSQGRLRLKKGCTDESGQMMVAAATRARLNDVGYVDGVAPVGAGEYESVKPADWGDQMFGMVGDNMSVRTIEEDIETFLTLLQEAIPNIGETKLQELRDKYTSQFLAGVA